MSESPRPGAPAQAGEQQRPAGRFAPQAHLGPVGAPRGRRGVPRGVDGVGAEEVGAGTELGQRRDQGRVRRRGAPGELGRQLGPGGRPAALEVDRPGRGSRERVAHVRPDLARRPVVGPAERGERDPRRDVVEAQRHRDRGARRLVAGLVAQPEGERVLARGGKREALERRAVPPGRELGARVIAAGARQPKARAGDRARRALVGVRPGEVELGRSGANPPRPRRCTARGCAGALLSIRTVRAGAHPALPAKSSAHAATACGPSLKLVVATGWVTWAAVSHGRIWRRAPFAPDRGLRAGQLGEADAGAVEDGFGEAQARADVARGDRDPLRPAPPAAAEELAAERRARRLRIFESDGQRPQPRPGGRVQGAAPRFRFGAQQAVLERRHRRREPATNSVGVVSVAAALRNGSKPPGPTTPTRCSNPSCSACHQLARTLVIQVPAGALQRQRPKWVPATAAGPSRVRLFRWTPSKGSEPAGGTQKASGRNLSAAGVVGPVGVGADEPPALGDRVLLRPRLPGGQQQQRQRQRDPHRRDPSHSTPRSRHLLPLRWSASGGQARGRRELSPLCCGLPRSPLCENGRDGTPDRGPDHREAARRDRPRAAPLDRRARDGALDRPSTRTAASTWSSR